MDNKELERMDTKHLRSYQTYYDESSFWDKIKSVAKKAGGKVIYCALLLYCVMKSPSVPTQQKLIIVGALGYFILPVDLIPDFIPVAGYTDDWGALIACYLAVKNNITSDIEAEAKEMYEDWFGESETPNLE